MVFNKGHTDLVLTQYSLKNSVSQIIIQFVSSCSHVKEKKILLSQELLLYFAFLRAYVKTEENSLQM